MPMVFVEDHGFRHMSEEEYEQMMLRSTRTVLLGLHKRADSTLRCATLWLEGRWRGVSVSWTWGDPDLTEEIQHQIEFVVGDERVNLHNQLYGLHFNLGKLFLAFGWETTDPEEVNDTPARYWGLWWGKGEKPLLLRGGTFEED